MKFPFLNNPFRSSGRSATLGLEIRPDGIAWALAVPGRPWQTGFDECTPAQREHALKARAQTLNLNRCRVRVVLPLDQYQLFAIDRPPVEDAELASAVRWKLKDLLDFPVEDAVIDVFEFPADAARGQGALVNAVVARKTLIQDAAALMQEVGLDLVAVDIAELAMRNVLASCAGDQPSMALVYLRQQYGHMVICQGDVLYLSRRLDVGTRQLEDAAAQEQAIMSLGLEVQRSLDYYESQLRQVPPRRVHIVGHDQNLPLDGLLGRSLAAEVAPLSLDSIPGLSSMDARVLYAAGAAQPSAGGEA